MKMKQEHVKHIKMQARWGLIYRALQENDGQLDMTKLHETDTFRKLFDEMVKEKFITIDGDIIKLEDDGLPF